MDDLEDDLDLRFHKGLTPDVYYRCPTLESLEGALRNELDKSAAALIPTAIVTEFLFAATSTLTIPVTQQAKLDALIQPADFLQSITAEHALCRNINGKDQVKAQRAIARSIIDAIEEADGFKYTERSITNTKDGDGARLRYVCKDSPQGRVRGRLARAQSDKNGDGDDAPMKDAPLTFDCGGAIHVKFSRQREAINVVYKHNPIHTHADDQESESVSVTEDNRNDQAPVTDTTNMEKKRKRRSRQKAPATVAHGHRDPELPMATSPEAPVVPTKKSRQESRVPASTSTTQKTSTKKSNKSNELLTPAKSRQKVSQAGPSVSSSLTKRRACIRCREKKVKCNEAKPTCNQCQRGLWTCQYKSEETQKRSRNSCVNCKQRRRKCTEERPFCAHCIRLDDDCEYAEYS